MDNLALEAKNNVAGSPQSGVVTSTKTKSGNGNGFADLFGLFRQQHEHKSDHVHRPSTQRGEL